LYVTVICNSHNIAAFLGGDGGRGNGNAACLERRGLTYRITITTPVISALKNYYVIQYLDLELSTSPNGHSKPVSGAGFRSETAVT
jgi:hypothetical protein